MLPPHDAITVDRALSRDDASALVGAFPEAMPATISRPTIARDPDGAPVFAYLPLPRAHVAAIRRACLAAPLVGVWRSNLGYETASTVFGSAPRKPQQAAREGCNRTIVHQTRPDVEGPLEALALDVLAPALQAIDGDQVDRDRAYLDRVGADWRIGGDGLWTSGVVNKNSQLPYHRDSLNFPTWSAMPVVRRGVRGGHLHLPEYDTVLPCRDGWSVYWCGNQVVHGVTPIETTTPDAYRFSIVYYALRGMKDCHTYAQETAYARARRTTREADMARRLVTGEKLTGANARLGTQSADAARIRAERHL